MPSNVWPVLIFTILSTMLLILYDNDITYACIKIERFDNFLKDRSDIEEEIRNREYDKEIKHMEFLKQIGKYDTLS